MDFDELYKKYNERSFDSNEWMNKQGGNVILNDEFVSPYDSKTKAVLEELQELYDDYEKKFKHIPPIGMFDLARQKEILKEALMENTAVDMKKLL